MLDNFNRFVIPNLGLFMDGLLVTVRMCAIAFAMAVVMGAVACLIRLYVPVLRVLAIAYIEFSRATPIIVQLLWVNYVWPELFGFPKSVEWAGIIALAIQSSGYLAETFRSGIEGLSHGQVEASLAVGMTRAQAFRRIVAPQVVLVMSPSIINQLAVVVKASTLVSIIAIPDLMYDALKVVNQWFEPIEVLTSVAVLYILTIFALSAMAKWVADHFREKYGLDAQA
jgi:polar amino acid transport system permease protein